MIGSFFPKRKSVGNSNLQEIPDEARVFFEQAYVLSHHGKTESALNFFRQAVEIAPRFTPALHEMGNCLNDLGRPEEASECYSRALEEIGNRLYEIGRYEESMGRFWEAIGRYEEAGKYFQRGRPDERNINEEGTDGNRDLTPDDV